MLSALAAIAAAFTLQAAPQPTTISAVCQIDTGPAQACQVSLAQEDGVTGLFFTVQGGTVGFVGQQTAPDKLAVLVVGIGDQAAPVDEGSYCQVAASQITCRATLGGETLTVKAQPTR